MALNGNVAALLAFSRRIHATRGAGAVTACPLLPTTRGRRIECKTHSAATRDMEILAEDAPHKPTIINLLTIG